MSNYAPQGQKFDPQTGQPIVHVQMSQEEMNMKMLQMTAQQMPPQQPMQSKQETVVQIQAADGGSGVPMDPPADTNSLMIWSIFNILCCGFICGIAALYFTITANGHRRDSSQYRCARNLNIASTAVGGIFVTIGIIVVIILTTKKHSSQSSTTMHPQIYPFNDDVLNNDW